MPTETSNIQALVEQDSIGATGEGTYRPIKVNKMGFLVTVDFYTQMAIEGRCYQARAGTVATGLAADSTLTDTAAQMCVDAPTGTTIIPAEIGLAMLDVATGTNLQAALKAVGAASTAGTAFVPLPLLQGGAASLSSARAMTDGGVTVAAEVATTTRRLWEFVALQTQSATVLAVGSLGTIAAAAWRPLVPYIGVGVACVYLQVASTTAFTLHYGHLNYVELPTTAVS